MTKAAGNYMQSPPRRYELSRVKFSQVAESQRARQVDEGELSASDSDSYAGLALASTVARERVAFLIDPSR